ncbi:hypothetical protein OG864_00625 [Streptomyces sp. NBC_00124]|uniref:hypothetical protein n=1 Tax=Streptomyces sp. NBC_00124 TaxID=2975662 RepID=UPI00224E9DE4|nr:hypothetical protein [Streptomyces sp. NBC_00124]MCX5357287.1 hypothetical protein [Streptomyces sp. NBC_00124]
MLITASPSSAILGIPVASLAFAVSLLSLTVALGALCWQIAKHRLDGGRPKVYLNTVIWEPNSKIMVNRSGKWEFTVAGLGEPGSENIELAQLVVENPGRTAITVYTPGLAIKGTRKPDYTISPRAFELKGFGADSSTSDTSVRIDPYDRVTFLLDYWSVTPRLLEEANGGRIQLRGCISVAGRSKPRLSSRRLAWQIPQGAWTARSDLQEISPFTVIWRELFKANTRNHSDDGEDGFPSFSLGVIVRTAMQKFPERPDSEEFLDALEQVNERWESENYQYEHLLFWMDQALDHHKGHLSDWAFTSKKRPA